MSTISCLSIGSCGGGFRICTLVSSLGLAGTVRIGCLFGSLGLGTLLFGLLLLVAGGALAALTAFIFFLITLVSVTVTTAGQRGRTLVVCLLVVVACCNDLDGCSRTAAFHVALFE